MRLQSPALCRSPIRWLSWLPGNQGMDMEAYVFGRPSGGSFRFFLRDGWSPDLVLSRAFWESAQCGSFHPVSSSSFSRATSVIHNNWINQNRIYALPLNASGGIEPCLDLHLH